MNMLTTTFSVVEIKPLERAKEQGRICIRPCQNKNSTILYFSNVILRT